VFVTHDQSEALSLSDQLAVLNEGRIEQVGSPETLYDAPATPFVRDFLGKTVLLACQIAQVSTHGEFVTLNDAPEVVLHATGRRGTDLYAGASCELAVRPEHLVVLPVEEAPDTGNCVPATILALFFLGDRYEARLRLAGDQRVLVPLPRTHHWQRGQAVVITFSPEAAHLWAG
jgi:ABC-type Fe3+/spermidine/putrescine transport system ATPase subunit